MISSASRPCRNLLGALNPDKEGAHAAVSAQETGLESIVKSLNESAAVPVGTGGQQD
jgi:hypothetical protein